MAGTDDDGLTAAMESGASDTAALLGGTSLFRGLDAAGLARLAAAAETRRHRRGEVLCREGDSGDELFVVVSGRVKVVVTSTRGDEMLLATLGPGEVFGELAVVDGGPRSATVTATETSTVTRLARPVLLEVLYSHPGMIDVLLTTLGGLVRRLNARAADLVFLDLAGRVAKLLLANAEEAGDTFELAITQSELASMVGGSRQTVNQILRGFERRGLVEVDGRKVVVRDARELRRQAGLPVSPSRQ